MIGYFPGVRVGLGSPEKFYGLHTSRFHLKSVYVDCLGDYAFFWSRSGDYRFHDFLSGTIFRHLKRFGTPTVYRWGDNLPVPDFVFGGNSFEVETGLKHSRNELINRFATNSGKTYIIVPNSSVQARYSELGNRSCVFVQTVKVFVETFVP